MRLTTIVGGLLTGALAIVQSGCVQPECAVPNFRRPECRVIAENDVARLRTSSDVEVRFQAADADDASTWDATGVIEQLAPGIVRARVAAPGDFALTVEPGPGAPVEIELVLQNVDPSATVVVGPDAAPVEMLPPPVRGTVRSITIDLTAGSPIWVRGSRPCSERYRIAAVGDIQTNPIQFERIVERLQEEADEATAAGEPLLTLILLGDVSESAEQEEFALIAELLERVPVPTAITPGNHDVFRINTPHYNRTFGPGNHAFDLCTTRVALVDSGNGSLARSIEGRLPELLDRGDADFLLAGTHYPAYSSLTGNGWGREDQAQHFMAELAIEDADLLLAGHIHALKDFTNIPVGRNKLREIIVGTGGAYQGLGVARYGYLRMTIGDELDVCFVEVAPPGSDEPANDSLSDALPNCE